MRETPDRSARFAAVGQSLIHHDLRRSNDPRFLSLLGQIRSADVAFTNFEGAVAPRSGEEPPDGNTSDPAALDDLRWMGFNLLSLANNHAIEAGYEGVVWTRQLAREKDFAVSGTGSTLCEATRPGILEVSNLRVGIVSMDTANAQTEDAVAGLEGRPGINPLRGEWVGGSVRLRPDDVRRNLEAIEEGAQTTDWLLVSIHEHLWSEDWSRPLQWKRGFARQCIDAGATAVFCHGIPRACAIEVYHGRPIFHSLGNFIFHSKRSRWHTPEVWEGFVATGVLASSDIGALVIRPIHLVDVEGQADVPYQTRWYPARVTGAVADRILFRLIAESRTLGTRMRRGDEGCMVVLD